MTERVPIAIGGVGGSGTRVVARIVSGAGLYLGDDLNRALDNLWFKLLFDRPRWLPGRLEAVDDDALARGLSVFRRAMTTGLGDASGADRAFVARATYEMARYGHDADGTGRGRWGLARGRSLLRARGHDPDASVGWGWKEPNSTMFVLEPMRRHLGRVRYVHVMRHGLDAAFNRLEVHRTWGGLYGGPTRPGPDASLAFWLAANERAIRVGETLYGEDLLVVRLEDLCADPPGEVRRLLAFAGVPADDDLVERLAALPSLPPSAGRYRDEDLSVFPPDDLDRVRALGYEVDAPAPRPAGPSAGRTRRGRATVSVALCTYEGERFLPELLDSVLAQTRPPDEVVAVDDGSTDGTVKLLDEFAATAPFPVRVVRNEENLGSTKNFEKAVGLCEGDLIFLCDQDDEWHRGKLARMEEVFAARPEVAATFSDADLIDEASRSTGHGLWDTLGFSPEMRRGIEAGNAMPVMVRGNVVTGAALAFRSSFRDLVLPIPAGWVQDAWIGILLGAVSRLHPLDEPLIRYRMHPAQQIGVPRPKTWTEHLRRRLQVIRRMVKQERPVLVEQASYFAQAAERLREMADRYPCPPAVLDEIEGKVRHFRARGAMPSVQGRWRAVSEEWSNGGYRRYSNGWVSATKDLLLPDRLGAGRGGGGA